MRTKDYRLATLEYDEKANILFFRIKKEQTVDVPEIKEMLENVQEFMGPVKHYAVLDLDGNLTTSSEARRVYADSEYVQKHRIATAVIVKSLSAKLIANFFINVTKPKVNTKLFTNESEAVNWIETLEKSSY